MSATPADCPVPDSLPQESGGREVASPSATPLLDGCVPPIPAAVNSAADGPAEPMEAEVRARRAAEQMPLRFVENAPRMEELPLLAAARRVRNRSGGARMKPECEGLLHAGQTKAVICYDVSDDRRRRKLSHFLNAFGTRVQESVFEALLTEVLFKRLEEGLLRLVDQKEDAVRIYFLPPSAWGKMKAWGPGRDLKAEEAPYLVV